MKFVFQLSIILTIACSGAYSLAQSSLEGVSTGRYEIRKRSPASEAPSAEDVDVVLKTPKVDAKFSSASTSDSNTPAVIDTKPLVLEPATPESEKTQTSTEEPKVEEVVEPGIQEQAESLFSSKASKIYSFYREQIHPDDIRNNRVEIDILPSLIYNDSQSNYSFRDYQSFFNALKFKSNVWFTPLIGVSGQILFSMAADLDAMSADRSRVSAKFEQMDLGINFRKFFGVSRKASSLEFSVLYSDHKMTVPSDTLSRVRIKSQGLGLGIKSRIPSSTNYAWVLGGSFFPRVQHSEEETGLAISSGSIAESSRVGLELGGEYKFTRESQMIWSLGMTTERNMFNGTATVADPNTGAAPSNVSVTNSTYLFSLGYRWGH